MLSIVYHNLHGYWRLDIIKISNGIILSIAYIQIFTVTNKFILLLYNKNITSGTINHYVMQMNNVNPFVPDAPFLYPLKTQKNHSVF